MELGQNRWAGKSECSTVSDVFFMGWQKMLPSVPEHFVSHPASPTEPEPTWGLFRWEIVVQRGKKISKFRGSGSFARIGGDPRCEVFLRQVGAPVISYLQFADGGMLFVDLSKASIEKVRPTAVLVGTSVNLGEGTWVTLSSLKNLKAPAQECPKQADSLSIVDRSVKTECSTGASFRIPKGISLLGASAACHLQLKHRTLSPFHSVVYRPNNPKLPLRIIDLCAFPTTLIDGTIAFGGCVAPGSTVRIGKLSFVAKANAETSGVDLIPQKSGPLEPNPNTADAQKEPASGFQEDHKAIELGVTNQIELMSYERPQVESAPSPMSSGRPTEANDASREILRAIDHLSESLVAISSRIDALEKRLDAHPSAPTAAPFAALQTVGFARVDQPSSSALISEPIARQEVDVQSVWPKTESGNGGDAPGIQVVAESDEVVVLNRLVALRTTQASARQRLFMYSAGGVACLLTIAVPILWFSVPSGWRERIMHELGRPDSDTGEVVKDVPYSDRSSDTNLPDKRSLFVRDR